MKGKTNCRHKPDAGWMAGFSLVELLVALSIFSIIAVAIYATFSTGVRARRRGEEATDRLQMSRVVLSQIAEELRNTVHLSAHPLSGRFDTLSFPSLVRRHLGPGGVQAELEIITYWIGENDSIRSLMRREESLAGEVRDTSEVISPIQGCRFRYYYPEEDGYEWGETWDSAGAFPLAVGVELTLVGGENAPDSGVAFTKVVPLPLSGVMGR